MAPVAIPYRRMNPRRSCVVHTYQMPTSRQSTLARVRVAWRDDQAFRWGCFFFGGVPCWDEARWCAAGGANSPVCRCVDSSAIVTDSFHIENVTEPWITHPWLFRLCHNKEATETTSVA